MKYRNHQIMRLIHHNFNADNSFIFLMVDVKNIVLFQVQEKKKHLEQIFFLKGRSFFIKKTCRNLKDYTIVKFLKV